jgi:hypothetical protein
MKSNTVFGHLVHQFAVHPENLATEALGYILRTSPAASRAFTNFVRQVLTDCPSDLRFGTQQVGLEKSIPDMKCVDDAGNIRVIVENKFWAGLTDNQPVTYIRELPAGVGALVLLVVPEARLQIVWDEVVTRCGKNEIPVCDVQKLQAMFAAGIGGGHYLAAVSWSALLDALSTATSLAAEVDSLNDIAQLSGLCRTMEQEAFLPLRDEELTNLEIARRVVNFSDLPFGIVKEALNQGLIDKKGVRGTPNRYGAGSYVRISGYSAWVGFHAYQWNRFGISPIWLNFYPDYCPIAEVRNRLRRLRNATPPRCFDMETGNYKWVAVPIPLASGVERQQIISDAVRQIQKIRDELGVQEPLAAPATGQTDSPGPIPECTPANQGENMTVETILELGAEGGSLNLSGNRDAAGHWRFWTQTDETTMNELLDEEDLRGLSSLVKTSEFVASLPEAFALLDKYPWCGMTPLQVHPQFQLAILHEVQRRGTPEEVASWSSNSLLHGEGTEQEQGARPSSNTII